MITSTSNGRVKHIRRLQADRRFRARQQAFVAEGTRWLSDLLTTSYPCQQLFYTHDWLSKPEHQALLEQIDGPKTAVSDEVMATMSDTQTPQGVLAELAWPQRPFPASPSLLLILDAMTNPGNLGTVLRTAAAAGVDGVLLGPGCVDRFNPKTVRGTMGVLLRLPTRDATWPEIAQIVGDLPVWLAAADGERVYTAVDWTQPAALLIGSEAGGAGQEARQLANGHIAIPMHAATESLNAAMAAAVILFEAARQKKLMVNG